MNSPDRAQALQVDRRSPCMAASFSLPCRCKGLAPSSPLSPSHSLPSPSRSPACVPEHGHAMAAASTTSYAVLLSLPPARLWPNAVHGLQRPYSSPPVPPVPGRTHRPLPPFFHHRRSRRLGAAAAHGSATSGCLHPSCALHWCARAPHHIALAPLAATGESPSASSVLPR